MSFRSFIFILTTTGIAILAILSDSQLLAIFCLCAAGGVFYKYRTLRIFEALLRVIENTQGAKVAGVEFSIENQSESIAHLYQDTPEWVQSLLIGMTSNQLGVLLLLSASDKQEIRSGTMHTIRELRAKGLAEKIGNEARLTETGIEFIEILSRGTRKAGRPHIANEALPPVAS